MREYLSGPAAHHDGGGSGSTRLPTHDYSGWLHGLRRNRSCDGAWIQRWQGWAPDKASGAAAARIRMQVKFGWK